MTAVDHTTTRPIPTVPRRRRRLGHRLAKPGWVIMTVLSLATVAVVSRYLAFNPDTYFPEQREVYMRREFVLGVHVLCGMLALVVGPLQFVGKLRCRFLRVHRFLGAVYIASCTRTGIVGSGPGYRVLPGLGDIVGLRVVGPEHAVHDVDCVAYGSGRQDR
jgi:hypothetical protein